MDKNYAIGCILENSLYIYTALLAKTTVRTHVHRPILDDLRICVSGQARKKRPIGSADIPFFFGREK